MISNSNIVPIPRSAKGALRRLKQNLEPEDDYDAIVKNRVQMIKYVRLPSFLPNSCPPPLSPKLTTLTPQRLAPHQRPRDRLAAGADGPLLPPAAEHTPLRPVARRVRGKGPDDDVRVRRGPALVLPQEPPRGRVHAHQDLGQCRREM